MFEASTLSTLYGSYVEGEEGTPKLKIKIYRKERNKIPRYMYKPPQKVPPKNKQTATHYITRKTFNIYYEVFIPRLCADRSGLYERLRRGILDED